MIPQTEAVFTAAVIEFARARGWLVHHCRPARTTKGWATPIQGDKGFPDLIMIRRGTLVVVELKGIGARGHRGVLDKEGNQKAWLEAWGGLGDSEGPYAETYVWWPDSDWQEVLV